MVTPDWLKAVAPAAAINSNVLNVFESLKDEDHCLAQVMQSITGKQHFCYQNWSEYMFGSKSLTSAPTKEK